MSLFGALKKKEPSDVPDVSDMLNSGMSEQDVIDNLRQQGYDSTTIKNALLKVSAPDGDTDLKQTASDAGTQTRQPQAVQAPSPVPQPSAFSPLPQFSPPSKTEAQKQGLSEQALDTIQQILEQVIEEKWQAASADLDSIKSSLRLHDATMKSVKDDIDKVNQRVDGIQNTMLGKTEDYNKTLADVNVELQAFEKVIDRLIPTISDSIRELRDLIDDLKKTKGQ